ncbi:hypothetical protein DAMA08_029250 [Martiniozyma asiatica (nom. inval.)]|nr:hypothetical protein DAMA08_029250 [Martiniozyma asiatica]
MTLLEQQQRDSPALAGDATMIDSSASNLKRKLDLADDDDRSSKKQSASTEDNLRQSKRNQEREAIRIKKKEEENKKREAKRLKKEEEENLRQQKKLQEEEEKRSKREKVEAARKAKKDQKEKEKLERQLKRESEQKAKEEKRKMEELEKLKRKEELEAKRLEKVKQKEDKLKERQKLENEKVKKKEQEEEKKKKRDIKNFFMVSKPREKSESSLLPSSSPIKEIKPIEILNKQDPLLAFQGLVKQNIESPTKSIDTTDTRSDFDKFFLPFHVNGNVTIVSNTKEVSSIWDEFFKGSNCNLTVLANKSSEAASTSSIIETKRASDVRQLLNTGQTVEADKVFKSVPFKYLRFYENRKPPYCGTYSYTAEDVVEDLRLNPTVKITPKVQPIVDELTGVNQGLNIDYDYNSDDSDNEDEEGEDVDADDDDDEEDEEDLASSDIDEFVEEDAAKGATGTARKVVGPLVALVRTCLDPTTDAEHGKEFTENFHSLQWERLRHDIHFPIDPFKNYWEDHQKEQEKIPVKTNKVVPEQKCEKGKDKKNSEAKEPVAVAMTIKRKIITDSTHVETLKQFILKNSSLTINTLAELAGKQLLELHSYARSVVKNTIKSIASFDKKSGVWSL